MLADWLDRHTRHAPSVLRSRVLDYTAGAEDDDLAGSLAEAGRRALDQVVAHPGDRSVALDLLAADALITLALLAEAQRHPERLGEFAAGLIR
ncbi:MAG: hypothetical protein ACAI18_11150 [Gemmatimonadales bacterium]